MSHARAIAMGASAGAVDTLMRFLPQLPDNYPLPVFIVVHIPADKGSVLPEIFRPKCRLPVREAEDKEPVVPGTIYFAPPGYHLMIEKEHTLSLSVEEPVHFSRPSIDVLFETAAEAYGDHLIGVVLTGANEDGAQGLKCISDAGGTALVQRPDEAFAAAMPQAALKQCPGALSLPLDELAHYLQKAVMS